MSDIPAALLLHEQPPAEVPADYLAFGRAVADYLRRAHGDHTPLVEIATRYGVAREVRTARTVVIVIPPPP